MGDVTDIDGKRKRGRGFTAGNQPDPARNPGRFRPGQSGNPGGRAKLPAEFHALAKAAAPEALELAVRFVRDETADPKLRLEAAKVVMARAHGQPTQQVDAAVTTTQRTVTVAELMAMADEGE